MKKALSTILCLALLISFCGSALAADVTYSSPGTYTASSVGKNGDVIVTATFSETAIESIEVDEAETPTLGGVAIETMKTQALDEQTLTPDAISGATESSVAFLTALAGAAEQAGASEIGEAKAPAAAEVDYSVTEADIIIVGAGGAGLTAAYSALDKGASVIVLEKSGVVGGNSLCSQQGINAAGSKVQEDLGMEFATPELLKEAQMSYGGREELVDAYVAASGETVDWFADTLGIEFSGMTGENVDPEDPLASVLTDHPGGGDVFMVKANADGYTSVTLINALDKALKAAGVTVYVNTEATALLTDADGRVVGVKATASDGSEIEFGGKAVLLATGGFGQNHEMLVEIRPDLENAITDEIAPTTGDGILMAKELGAKTVDLEYLQTFPHVPYGDTWLPPMSMPGGFMTTAIFVNQDAQRYTSEGFEVSDDTLKQEAAYVIFGEADMNDTLKLLEARGFVKSGDSPDELAKALGLDAEALDATIEQWNTDCAAGADSLFDNHKLQPLEGKLYGYRFGVGAHYMMGGLLINGDTQVLNEDEEPIPGLYAAGEVTGGFHGEVRIDGSGTGDAFTFGHLAGEKIAESVVG
jgi:flavocytochrome c